ncbi:MAG TPA: alpha/beta hydrolase [Anaerolineales bacterium]|nr:alpha/beta hydrolase [Anaerolineales bacterium]
MSNTSKFSEIEMEGHQLAVVPVHSSEAGVPIFLLHGIGGSISFWTPELTLSFHRLGPCYSLSLPGHFPAAFPKDFPADCLTAELIARLVANAIQKVVGNKRVLLVGHSTGGFAALSTAIYHPEIVAGVVSIAGFSKGEWTGTLGFCQWLVRRGSFGRVMFKNLYHMGGLHPIIFRLYWHAYVHDHAALVKSSAFRDVTDAMLPYFRELDMDTMVSYFTVMPRTDVTLHISKIIAPTCLIAGDQDPIVPPAQSSQIAEKVSNAKLVLLKGAGHLPFFERSTEYNKALEAWLTEFQQRN